jgi:hypothetical protein
LVDGKSTVFKLNRTLGRWIIRSLFGTPRTIRSQVVDVMRFAPGFNNPHWNFGICQMAFIKVKDSFLGNNIQNLLHDGPLSYSLFISYYSCDLENPQSAVYLDFELQFWDTSV